MQFSGIFEENPYFEQILGSGSPHPLGSKLRCAPWPKAWIRACVVTRRDQSALWLHFLSSYSWATCDLISHWYAQSSACPSEVVDSQDLYPWWSRGPRLWIWEEMGGPDSKMSQKAPLCDFLLTTWMTCGDRLHPLLLSVFSSCVLCIRWTHFIGKDWKTDTGGSRWLRTWIIWIPA